MDRPARRGGFFPLVLGGVLAAALGFAVAIFAGPDLLDGTGLNRSETALAERMTAQEAALEDLRATIPEPQDLGPLTEGAETLRGAFEARSFLSGAAVPSISWHVADAPVLDPNALQARLKRGAKWGAVTVVVLPLILVVLGLDRWSDSFDRYVHSPRGLPVHWSKGSKLFIAAILAGVMWFCTWTLKIVLLMAFCAYQLATFHRSR